MNLSTSIVQSFTSAYLRKGECILYLDIFLSRCSHQLETVRTGTMDLMVKYEIHQAVAFLSSTFIIALQFSIAAIYVCSDVCAVIKQFRGSPILQTSQKCFSLHVHWSKGLPTTAKKTITNNWFAEIIKKARLFYKQKISSCTLKTKTKKIYWYLSDGDDADCCSILPPLCWWIMKHSYWRILPSLIKLVHSRDM